MMVKQNDCWGSACLDCERGLVRNNTRIQAYPLTRAHPPAHKQGHTTLHRPTTQHQTQPTKTQFITGYPHTQTCTHAQTYSHHVRINPHYLRITKDIYKLHHPQTSTYTQQKRAVKQTIPSAKQILFGRVC